MADITQSLFGITPESLIAQREQQAMARGVDLAQLDPFQRAFAQTYAGASGLGREISGLLGAEDPELMRVRQRQGMLQNLDLSSPESLKQGIQDAMQRKDYALVNELTTRYQATTRAALEGRKTEAEIAAKLGEKLTPEQKNAAGLADAAGLQRGSKEWQDAYSKALSGLTNKNDPTAVVETADGVFLVNKSTGDKISRVGSAPKRGTEVNVETKGRSAFAEKLGAKDAERVDSAITSRENAVTQLDIADRIEAMSPTALSGAFAQNRAGMVNFLDSLGLTSPKDKQVLSSSQVLTSDSSRLVLASLNNKLGGGVSNADAERIAEIFPRLENSVEARKELVTIIRRSANKVIKESIRLENYARDKEGLKGYVPEISLPGTSARNPYSGLSDTELDARIKAAQANQKK